MCGIGGVWCFGKERLSKEDAEDTILLAELLEERGTDAFGWYNMEKVVKFPSAASEVIKQISKITPFERLIIGKRAFLMHTRLATVGDPLINENNHPFETKDFILAHNGSVYKYKLYITEKRAKADGKKNKVIRGGIRDRYDIEIVDPKELFGEEWGTFPETDSFTIIAELQKTYNEEKDSVTAFVETMRELHTVGVYAIWVYSKRDGYLMLYRDGNPLYYAIEDGKLWFASEDWMLKAIGKHDVRLVRNGTIMVYDESELVETIKIGSFHDPDDDIPTTTEIEIKFIECEDFCNNVEACKEVYKKYGFKLCESYWYHYG